MNTTISIYDLFVILFIHWVADFILQTDKQAKNKSTDLHYLMEHTFVYSFCFIPFAIYHTGDSWRMMFLFPIITLVFHTITDYFTSRLNAKLWREKEVHLFFVSVGFDQLLHFAQLIITFQLLK